MGWSILQASWSQCPPFSAGVGGPYAYVVPPLEGSTSPGAEVTEAGHPFLLLGRRASWFLGNGTPKRPRGLS